MVTAENITAAGPLLCNWIGDRGRRQLQMGSVIATSFQTIVQKRSHNLEPVVTVSTIKQKRNRILSVLWLIHKHISLADALLVICSFPSESLANLTFGELISTLLYLIHNQHQLTCEALEAEATRLLGG